KGIITALHGVIKYPDNIWAGRHEADKYHAYEGLKIIKVDLARDLALVSSPAIEALPADFGLEEASVARPSKDKDADKKNAEILQDLKVSGFPRAVFVHQRYSLTLARRRPTPLADIVKELGADYDALVERASPSVAEEVLSLSGFVQPGLSGAPVL